MEMNNKTFTGVKYDVSMDIKEVSKMVKKELKEKYPEMKFGVRIERYSMGQSLNIEIKKLGFNPYTKKDNNDVGFNEKFKELRNEIRTITKQYNHDSSDGRSDYYCVKFYVDIRVGSEIVDKWFNLIKAGC